MSIPRVIHYCWFGRNPLPESAAKCIDSWKKFLPDCRIKEWNEDSFDIGIIPYTKDAYQAGKFAFVSDYARFWAIYNEGGIYFDVDLELIKPIDDLLEKVRYGLLKRTAPKGGKRLWREVYALLRKKTIRFTPEFLKNIQGCLCMMQTERFLPSR